MGRLLMEPSDEVPGTLAGDGFVGACVGGGLVRGIEGGSHIILAALAI